MGYSKTTTIDDSLHELIIQNHREAIQNIREALGITNEQAAMRINKQTVGKFAADIDFMAFTAQALATMPPQT